MALMQTPSSLFQEDLARINESDRLERDVEVSINGGMKNGWFTVENSMKLDDDWG